MDTSPVSTEPVPPPNGWSMRIRALALAGLTALLLTACGGDSDSSDGGSGGSVSDVAASQAAADRSGPQIVGAAADALEQADAFRMQGSMVIEPGPAEVDLHVQGSDLVGSFVFGGQTVRIIALDGAVYMQAPASFWTDQGAPAAMASRLGGTWVMSPAEEGSEFAEFSVASVAEELRSPSDGATVAEEAVATSLDGLPVWEIRDSVGSVMHVAAEGEPYPLQITKTGAEAGVMRLSEFGTVAPIEPPADFLDLSDLAG